MKQDLLASLRAALVALLAFTVLTGLVYPLLVMGIGKAAFPHQAAGAPELIGQAFSGPGYFWSRPSALGPFPYNAMSSTGTNYGPNNPALHDQVAARAKALREADPGNTAPIPIDLVTSSASGLDPHISPAAAEYQVGRVARARGLSIDDVRGLIADHTEGRTFGVLGEARVDVVALNRALDAKSVRAR